MVKNNLGLARIFTGIAISAGLFLSVALAQDAAQETKKPAAKKSATGESAHTAKSSDAFIGTPDNIKWVPYAKGVEFGPVYGDCDSVGTPCVFQLRLVDGEQFPPHWHPVDENVTVISGTFLAGMGDTYDESKMKSLPPGTYIFMPRRMHHFAGAKGVTVVQVHGVGPFKTNFVNPADDPSKAAKATK